MQKKIVSIAMCTYNGEKYIKEQLSSIIEQTFENFELIITDDGSSDSTIEIIKKYQDKDNRIMLYQNEKNLGFKKNFEYAISLCSGEYIALADQDDIWKSNKLEVFLESIKDNVLIYSDAILIDKDSQEIGKELVRSEKRNLVSGNCNKAFILDNCVSGNTLMFKRSLVANILPIPETISYHDIWIAFVASTYGTIIYTEEAMTYYRRYSEQITHRDINNDFKYEGIQRLYNLQKQKEIFKKQLVHVKDLSIFLKVEKLDTETKQLIQMLKSHFIRYNSIYFNKKLNTLLKKHENDILSISDISKRAKIVSDLSHGLLYYKNPIYFLYSFSVGIMRFIRLNTKEFRYKLKRKTN